MSARVRVDLIYGSYLYMEEATLYKQPKVNKESVK